MSLRKIMFKTACYFLHAVFLYGTGDNLKSKAGLLKKLDNKIIICVSKIYIQQQYGHFLLSATIG
jgi:hypothetical protein